MIYACILGSFHSTYYMCKRTCLFMILHREKSIWDVAVNECMQREKAKDDAGNIL